MISLYSGTPGSGKSCHTAQVIQERLWKRDAIVIGNFFINTKLLKKCRGTYLYVQNYRLTPERLILFSRRLSRHYGRRLREGELLVVIDEAQLLFNSRDWQTPGRRSWLSFFTQHRHFGYDFILVAQFDRMLDRQVRSLIEYEYVHRKVKNAGKIGAVLGFLSGGKMFVSICRWYPIGEKVSMNFFFGSKKLFSLYDSYNAFEPVNEITAKSR